MSSYSNLTRQMSAICLAMVGLTPLSVLACSCARYDATEWVNVAPVIVEVEIVERQESLTTTRKWIQGSQLKAIPVAYRVTRPIQGSLSMTGRVFEMGFEAACDRHLVPGDRFLLFLGTVSEPMVYLCNSRPSSEQLVEDLLSAARSKTK